MMADKPSPREILEELATSLDFDAVREKFPKVTDGEFKKILSAAASKTGSKSKPAERAAKPAVHCDLPERGWVVNIDGASRGNPGPAASAAFIRTPDGVFKLKKKLGVATNNIAEYTALIMVLEAATSRGVDCISVRSDSELLVKQIKGQYQVKHPNLIPLYKSAKNLEKKFKSFTIVHVRREANADADAIANEALDEGCE